MIHWARSPSLNEQFHNILCYVDKLILLFALRWNKTVNEKKKRVWILDFVFTWFPRTKHSLSLPNLHLTFLSVVLPGEQPCNCVLIWIRANRSSSRLTWHLQCSERQLRHVWPLARSYPVIDIQKTPERIVLSNPFCSCGGKKNALSPLLCLPLRMLGCECLAVCTFYFF